MIQDCPTSMNLIDGLCPLSAHRFIFIGGASIRLNNGFIDSDFLELTWVSTGWLGVRVGEFNG